MFYLINQLKQKHFNQNVTQTQILNSVFLTQKKEKEERKKKKKRRERTE